VVALVIGILGAATALAFDPPTNWTPLSPSTPMRLAEWRVRERSEVAIFFFGPGQGGSAEANVDRWMGQFEQPDGASTRDRSKRSETRVGDLKVTRVDITGTYVASVRPGRSERRNEPDYRMIAAVIEGPGGPWFIRFLGPREEVSREEVAFDSFLSKLRLE
jgi:hypothetical protein